MAKDTPVAGKRFRIERIVKVDAVTNGWVEADDGGAYEVGKWDWFEQEPEYANRALYLDALGYVYQRENLGWLRRFYPGSTAPDFEDRVASSVPRRPLKRLTIVEEE